MKFFWNKEENIDYVVYDPKPDMTPLEAADIGRYWLAMTWTADKKGIRVKRGEVNNTDWTRHFRII